MMTKKSMKAHTREAVPPRRNFLIRIWMALGVVAFAELFWVIFSFLRRGAGRIRANGADRLIEAGPVSGFTPKTVTAFPRGHFYLVCLEDGGFLALSRRCTHLGCTVPWVEEKHAFVCPCHSSVFDLNGDVIQSPAPRALDLYRVIVENNVVSVDTGRVVKRSTFKKDQVVYPTRA